MPMTTRSRTGAGRRVDYVSLAGIKRKAVAGGRKRAAKQPKASAALTKVVTSIVRKQAEVKNVMRVLDNYTLYNSAISTPDWVYPVPDIQVGTTETQRIGDRVKPKALIVKLHVAFNTQIGGHAPIKVRVHVVKHKKFTSQAQLALNMPVDGQRLLMDGNGAVADYDGTIENSQFSLNTDLWSAIKTLNFTLSKDNTCPTTGSPFREFVIRIPCPKTLVYTDSTQSLPENFCPAMALGYCYVNGQAPDITGSPVMAYAQSFFTYTDE